MPEARSFLMARIEHLKTLSLDSSVHYALSTTYHYLRQHSTALFHARQAIEEDPSNQEMAWHMELVLRQNSVSEQREDCLRKLNLDIEAKMPQPLEVLLYMYMYMYIIIHMYMYIIILPPHIIICSACIILQLNLDGTYAHTHTYMYMYYPVGYYILCKDHCTNYY